MLTPLPDVHDLASELLLGMRLSGVQYRRIHVARPFGLSFDEAPERAQFHFVRRGLASLRDASGAMIWLEADDAVSLPQGIPHVLLSDPDTPCRKIAGFESAKICNTAAPVDAGVEAAPGDAFIFNACMELDLGGMQPLVGTMPEPMHVGTPLACYPEIRPMLDAMEHESCSERVGFAGILTRLVDVVVAFIVRGWVECGCGDTTGWVQALREPKLGPAIVALHRDPGRNWSVAESAAQAGVSRSVFTERFLAAAGVTPVCYLIKLRMWFVAQWITRDREAIEAVVYRLGCGLLTAFSRAFKWVVGRPPGAMRARGAEADARRSAMMIALRHMPNLPAEFRVGIRHQVRRSVDHVDAEVG